MRFHAVLSIMGALALSACADSSDPWMSESGQAAVATPGARTLIAAHTRHEVKGDMTVGEHDEDAATCEIGEPAPLVEIQQGAHGTITFERTTVTLNAPNTPCDGMEAPASGVYYEGLAEAVYDTVVYRELLAPADPDVTHTVHLRVR